MWLVIIDIIKIKEIRITFINYLPSQVLAVVSVGTMLLRVNIFPSSLVPHIVEILVTSLGVSALFTV